MATNNISTDELLEKFNNIKYESWGHGAVQIWKMIHTDKWRAGLRNEITNKQHSVHFEGDTANEALHKLYEYCQSKSYL